MRAILAVITTALVVSCRESSQRGNALEPGMVIGHPDSAIWRAVPPLDTAALLALMRIADSAQVKWTPDANSAIVWQERIDAINVRNMMPACTCPDFAVLDSLQFGVKEVYLLPVNDAVKIPERMDVAGNAFWLIGERSVDTLRPPRTMGPPWPGYFFRYGSYRIVRPYRVWGPRVFDASADTSAGEDPWVPSHLTVR